MKFVTPMCLSRHFGCIHLQYIIETTEYSCSFFVWTFCSEGRVKGHVRLVYRGHDVFLLRLEEHFGKD